MGLDEFKTDSSSSSSSSSSSDTESTSTTNQTKVDNTPSYMTQAFTDHTEVSPRAIKYEIKSVIPKFTYVFSMSRFDTGELVAYSVPEDGKSVVVFTTIQSQLDSGSPDDNKPLKVVKWNFEEQTAYGGSETIEYDSSWDSKLRNTILEMLD